MSFCWISISVHFLFTIPVCKKYFLMHSNSLKFFKPFNLFGSNGVVSKPFYTSKYINVFGFMFADRYFTLDITEGRRTIGSGKITCGKSQLGQLELNPSTITVPAYKAFAFALVAIIVNIPMRE